MSLHHLRLPGLMGLALLLVSCAMLEEVATTDRATGHTSEARIAEGLREALCVGTERASDRVSQVDGYLANELIRIPLPETMRNAAGQMRRVGLGRQVDRLEVAMNRAAETAASEAVAVFTAAIRQMQPPDVYAIFQGGNDAATRYLRQTSEAALRQRYQPIVAEHLQRVEGLDLYREIATTWNQLPMVQPLEVDLDRHVTDRALDGLFSILAEEERRIREDPIARTTAILREVFGGR